LVKDLRLIATSNLVKNIGLMNNWQASVVQLYLFFLKEEEKIRVTYAEEFEKSNPQDFSQSDIQNICY
jgi:hypothetical protein